MVAGRWARRLLLPLTAIAVLALAACSGDSPSAADEESPTVETSTPAPEAPTGTQRQRGGFGGSFPQLDEAQIEPLFACLEGRGFEIPAGATSLQTLFDGDPPSTELQAALGECGTEVGVTLPGGFRGGGGFGGGAANREGLLECLSAEGLDVEELAAPGDGGAPGQGGPFAGLEIDDPDVAAALELCAPGFQPGGAAQ